MMRRLYAIALAAALMMACASLPRYNAPFAEIDQDGDGVIEWWEFRTHFPDTDPKTFLEADRNKNGEISLEEWKFFVETHGP